LYSCYSWIPLIFKTAAAHEHHDSVQRFHTNVAALQASTSKVTIPCPLLCHKKFFTTIFCHTICFDVSDNFIIFETIFFCSEKNFGTLKIFGSPKFEDRFSKKCSRLGAASQGASLDANQRGIHPTPQIHGEEITLKCQIYQKLWPYSCGHYSMEYSRMPLPCRALKGFEEHGGL
jgi:hypothetical protein